MLIYLLIYIPFVLSAYFDFKPGIKQETKSKILWGWVFVFTLFWGLRWRIGTDWEQFYYVYRHAHWYNIFNYERNESGILMDYGYVAVNALFNDARLPYTVFLLVSSFWILWCYKDFSLRFTKYPILTFILIMNIGMPFPVRQTLSFATMLWGFSFAMEKQWIKFAIVWLTAGLIHKGSFIGIVVIVVPYLVERWRIKWWIYAVIYASTFIIAEIFMEFILKAIPQITSVENQMSAYSELYLQLDTLSVDYGDYNSSMMNGYGYMIFFAVLLWVREKYKIICGRKIKYFETFFFMYAIVAIIDNICRQGSANGMVEMLGRVTTTVDMFPLIFPLVFSIFLLSFFKDKLVCWILFCIYMFYKFWQQIPGSFYNFVFIPYHSIFEL